MGSASHSPSFFVCAKCDRGAGREDDILPYEGRAVPWCRRSLPLREENEKAPSGRELSAELTEGERGRNRGEKAEREDDILPYGDTKAARTFIQDFGTRAGRCALPNSVALVSSLAPIGSFRRKLSQRGK